MLSRISRITKSKKLAARAFTTLKQTYDSDREQHKLLRSDVRKLGTILGNVLDKHSQDNTLENIERIRDLSKRWRDKEDDSNACFKELTTLVKDLNPLQARDISKAFSIFLSLANLCENHHRARRLKDARIYALPDKNDSVDGVIKAKLDENFNKIEIYNALIKQRCEIVLTSHPTEVNRKTLLKKHSNIQKYLAQLDNVKLRPNRDAITYDIEELDNQLYREIEAIWLSDEVVRSKPTPQEEARRGIMVIDQVLWQSVPSYLKKLDATLVRYFNKHLPFTVSPIKFASWQGGDRDGNPNVTPDVTNQVCMNNRWTAARLIMSDLREIREELSIYICSDGFRRFINSDAREPYRYFIDKFMIPRIEATIKYCEMDGNLVSARGNAQPFFETDELQEMLLMMCDSLKQTNNSHLINGRLIDLLRNLATFGITLVPVDVRQESTAHANALSAITEYLNLGTYSEWDEGKKVEWLKNELTSKRPLIHPNAYHKFPDAVTDTFGIFEMIAKQPKGSLGSYVISQASDASDVLAVLLLQRNAGVKKLMPVVPLFETLSDLQNAPDSIIRLFDINEYLQICDYSQQIMIGYSDSSKDAGRLAASWAQYEAQEKLAQVARDYKVNLTFFHGKGGTIGRGGNPATFKSILAHVPGTVNGNFRVTEQGEMITYNFGHRHIAERVLDIYSAGLLAEQFTKRVEPNDEYRRIMRELSAISFEKYASIVKKNEHFVPYFRNATPEQELNQLKIGSRPAKRNPKGGVESLRAIPWNFSWTQTRFNLPTWLGVGEAISTMLDNPDDEVVLRKMYNEWSHFNTMIDLIAMVLLKSEIDISSNYDHLLLSDQKEIELANELKESFNKTLEAILSLTNNKILCESNELLHRALSVRNPYIDPLNIIQAEILSRKRKLEDQIDNTLTTDPHYDFLLSQKTILDECFLTTVNGIAAGMQNSG